MLLYFHLIKLGHFSIFNLAYELTFLAANNTIESELLSSYIFPILYLSSKKLISKA